MTLEVWHLGISPSGVGSGAALNVDSATSMLPGMRTLVGDPYGRILAELRPNWQSFAWRLGEIDKATFKIARTDPLATETNLHWGNRILALFDNGLPAWGGTIETPTKWSTATIDVTCYGIEYLLQFRTTDKTRAFNNVPVGHIFKTLLTEAQYGQDMGLTFGRIWYGGRHHNPRYHFSPLWTIFKNDLMGTEGCDVYFRPHLSDHKIKFEAQVHERLGDDKSGKFALSEGFNVAVKEFTEQGTIVNQFAAVGTGTTWGDERVHAIATERTSRAAYGLRQNSKVYSNVSIASTCVRYAKAEVEESAYPHRRIQLSAVNESPATFGQYTLGDELTCVLPSYGWGGFTGTVRVLSREFIPDTGVCELIVEEVTAPSVDVQAGQEEGAAD